MRSVRFRASGYARSTILIPRRARLRADDAANRPVRETPRRTEADQLERRRANQGSRRSGCGAGAPGARPRLPAGGEALDPRALRRSPVRRRPRPRRRLEPVSQRPPALQPDRLALAVRRAGGDRGAVSRARSLADRRDPRRPARAPQRAHTVGAQPGVHQGRDLRGDPRAARSPERPPSRPLRRSQSSRGPRHRPARWSRSPPTIPNGSSVGTPRSARSSRDWPPGT